MTPPATDKSPGRIARLIKRLTGDREGIPSSMAELRNSDTAKAAGLAGAMIANNVIALISTVVFARLLGDYGSLAALVSYFLILSVVGQALQVATAREGVLGHLGVGPGLAATVKRWTINLMALTAILTVISVVLREPIAQAVGVKRDQWGAAIGIPAAMLWLELSILRGVLQSVGDYKGLGISLVGEQAARLVLGATLAAVGLGVTGAYLGTPLSFVAMGLFVAWRLRQHLEESTEAPLGTVTEAPTAALSLWTHVKRAWAPIAGLVIIAVLQNIDIIAAKHRFSTDVASSYGATAVAAKVVFWVAIGAGFYLVPEVSRRRSEGLNTRPILFRALAIVGVCAVPCLLIFAVAPHELIKLAFGEKRTLAANSLLVLGAAFSVLATTYLAIQYMLAEKRTWFLLPLAAIAVAEPILLLNASRNPKNFAAVVLAVQVVAAAVAFTIALRWDNAPRKTGDPGPPESAVTPRPPEVASSQAGREATPVG
jgi:O-antigen/teichoic acid export membrane protein